MKNVKLSKEWDSLRSSYWFLPGLMAAGGMAMAFATLALDQGDQVELSKVSWIYQGGPEGARGLLSSIAGSMVSVAATAFSITIVALQLAAANFGPRLLRNFMQDTGNQIVLGTFIATFLYCLLVLRTIRGEDYNLFVPQLSVTIGIILAIASIGVLIYFIHHASTIIQASHVISSVVDELDNAIERLFPERLGQGEQSVQERATIPPDFEDYAYPIKSNQSGYLQAIENQALLKAACKNDLLLRIELLPGDFIFKGETLVLAYGKKQLHQDLADTLNRMFLLGRDRTEQQDIRFPINQLVEIALRVLSPGINDPLTAVRCIDRLTAGLTFLAEREFPSAYRYDQNQALRIIAEPVKFEDLADLAFSPIRRYGNSNLTVVVRLLDAIAEIAPRTHRPQDRFALEQQADMILQSSRDGLPQKYNQKVIEERYKHAINCLRQASSSHHAG